MKIFDLSQEVFSAQVFPGDPAPSARPAARMEDGSPCNLAEITLGSHTGTHMDAPLHFCREGRPIDRVDLTKCVRSDYSDVGIIQNYGRSYPDTIVLFGLVMMK